MKQYTNEEKTAFFANVFKKYLDEWKKTEKANGRKGTQGEFANKTSLHINSICNFKTGKVLPDMNSLNAICNEFGVAANVFFPEHSTDINADIETLKRMFELKKSIRKIGTLLCALTGDNTGGAMNELSFALYNLETAIYPDLSIEEFAKLNNGPVHLEDFDKASFEREDAVDEDDFDKYINLWRQRNGQ